MNETVKNVLELALAEAEYNLNEAAKAHEKAKAAVDRAAQFVKQCEKTMLDLAGALKDE